MPTPLQNLQSQMSAAGAAPLAPPTQTAQIQNILTTKATGRAGPATAAPAATNIQEQMALQVARGKQQELQRAGTEAAGQLGLRAEEQQQGYQQAGQELDEKEIGIREDYQRQVESVFNDLSRGTRQLDSRRDQAKFEQIGFQLRHTNQQYIDSIRLEGAKSRLISGSALREALARTVFAEEESLFRNDLSFRAMLGADERQFKEKLGEIDIERALALADAGIAAANTQAMVSGVSGLLQTGVQAYGVQQSGGFSNEYSDYEKSTNNPVSYSRWKAGGR